MNKGNQKLEYCYLDMDNRYFVETQEELTQNKIGGKIISATNYEYNQIIIAAGERSFTEMEAILLCRRLSGVTKANKR